MDRDSQQFAPLYDDNDIPRPRLGRRTAFHVLLNLPPAKGPWYETPEQIEAGIIAARERELWIAWVKRALQRLPVLEARSIQLIYFEELTYRQAGRILGKDPATVLRAVRRGLAKLETSARRRAARLASRPFPRAGKRAEVPVPAERMESAGRGMKESSAAVSAEPTRKEMR